MENKDTQNQVGLGISKIREIEFSMAQSSEFTEANYTIAYNSEFNVNANTFEIQLVADLVPLSGEKPVLHIKVSNLFVVDNLAAFYSEQTKRVNIPNVLFVTMLSISITHTRALLARNTSGTYYEKYLLPIVNPADMVGQIQGANNNQ